MPLPTRLAATGVEASNSRDVVRLVHEGNVSATRMVRAAGRTLGEVLAGTVNFFNPAVIVIGGDIAEAHAQLLAGVREGIFSRSLPLATRDLRIVPCRLGDRAGVTRRSDNRDRAGALTGGRRSDPADSGSLRAGRLNGLKDLAGLEAASADVLAPGSAPDEDADLLEVRVEAPPGRHHGVAAVIPERGALFARVTDLCHGASG